MKKVLMAVSAILLAGTSVQAADLFRGGPSFSSGVVGTYSWIGPYIGATLGYEWNHVTNAGLRPSGFNGGITGGYNWQSGQFVYGVEGDIQLSGADDVFAPWKFSNPWFSTLRGRAGVAMNNILFYGTVGFALGSGKAQNLAGLTESRTHPGWTIGAGMEVGLSQNWSAKAEYLYLDLAERGYSITTVNHGFGAHVLRLGVNYHF